MEKKYQDYLLLASIFCFFYAFPILISDSYYIDDLGRSIRGFAHWTANGRPAADEVMIFLNAGMPLTDTSPLPQMLAVAAFVAIGALVGKVFFDGRPLISALAALSLICSPYLLENLSYKFDSLTMALSIALAICAAIFNLKSPIVVNVALKSLLVVLVFSLYQASVNIYIAFCVILFVHQVRENLSEKALFKALSQSILSLLIAFVIYSKLIAKRVISGTYSIEHSESTFDISTILSHLVSYAQLALTLFENSYFRYLFAFYLLIAVAATLLIAVKYLQKSGFGALSLIIASLVVLAPLLIILTVPGSLIFLKQPVFSPRTLVGFVSLMFFLLFCTHSLFSTIHKNITSVLMLPLFILLTSLAYSYSAALNKQWELETYLTRRISEDLNSLKYDVKKDKVIMLGKEPYAAVTLNSINKFPILALLIQRHLVQQWVWGYVALEHNVFLQGTKMPSQKDFDIARAQLSQKDQVLDRDMYSISEMGIYKVIMLKENR
ncbi:glucosyltransferase domain-containing protein [Serratia entomophila]|uniref:glucosyltransferase domain-containing protein n=1 Tax=Serratia entomophila TaxID=42906 RepID=UPI002177C8AD|nr:glucosyltransferase domain-containing protein [Serratia entomophila]CAI1148376.1 Uncharacterised protein [Serratia entomophila]CAI1880747.1 Uncharacterised protein [Serratia entomophila]CAI1891652.1 Uncharacterised protein [Serratia entomophila]CAI1944806.1 Uncharacterised protein [Serratia entomophila]CAI1974197.1 Uncharacterised protein [Serratia entomophila]